MEVAKDPGNSPEEQINRWVVAYESELLRLCCVCLRDAVLAEDAVQETFIKAYKGLDAFRGECDEKTWLYRIAINVCRSMLRGTWFHHVDRTVSLERVQAVAPMSPCEDLALRDGILSLPRKYREVILLYYYEDMKLTDIGKALGVSAVSVSRRLKKARKLLKDMLEGDEDIET